MKKFLAPFLAGTMVLISGCSSVNNTVYQYPFKTAKIEYAISGTTEGKSTISIKGDKYIREAHILFHKPTGDENQDNMFIDLGQYVYSVDLTKKTGTMTKNPLYETIVKVEPGKRQEFLKKIAAGISPENTETKELKSLGTETIAGKQCEVYETGGFGQICLWNNIPLKTTISIADLGLTNNTVATSIQTDIDIPDSTFDVPQDVQIQKIGVDGQTSGTQQ